MYRRSLLATTAAAAAVAAAGCVDGSDAGESGDDGPDSGSPSSDSASSGSSDSDGSDSAASSVAVATEPESEHVEIDEADAETVGEAVIEFTSDAVHVDGTVLGETGCHGVALADATVTDDRFRMVVAAVDDSDPEELCTQALTEVGYAVDATFVDGVPGSVTVVHDDADGHAVVATDSPDDV